MEDNNQGVTCLSCHTIKSIEKHKKANKNIYETKDRVLYSAQKGMEDKIVEYKKRVLGLVYQQKLQVLHIIM